MTSASEITNTRTLDAKLDQRVKIFSFSKFQEGNTAARINFFQWCKNLSVALDFDFAPVSTHWAGVVLPSGNFLRGYFLNLTAPVNERAIHLRKRVKINFLKKSCRRFFAPSRELGWRINFDGSGRIFADFQSARAGNLPFEKIFWNAHVMLLRNPKLEERVFEVKQLVEKINSSINSCLANFRKLVENNLFSTIKVVSLTISTKDKNDGRTA